MIIMIAAVAENNALGKNNELVWHLPNDFKRFKSLTTGHHIIMGRKTFESFPKPLPNRTHVVITRQENYRPEGCIVVNSIEKAVAICPKNETSFIIGGGEIYNLGLPYTDKLEITRVHHSFEADAFFPEINPDNWQEIHTEFNPIDDKHLYEYTYQTYIKKI
jgi:dihydrofolate reductase